MLKEVISNKIWWEESELLHHVCTRWITCMWQCEFVKGKKVSSDHTDYANQTRGTVTGSERKKILPGRLHVAGFHYQQGNNPVSLHAITLNKCSSVYMYMYMYVRMYRLL